METPCKDCIVLAICIERFREFTKVIYSNEPVFTMIEIAADCSLLKTFLSEQEKGKLVQQQYIQVYKPLYNFFKELSNP